MNGVGTAQNAAAQPTSERAWWRRLVVVLHAPTSVFSALRDDSDDAVARRQEPVTALVFLAGIALVLSLGGAARLLDDPDVGAALVVFGVIFAGAVQGLVGYWVAGALVYLAVRLLGSPRGFRRVRHVVAFAAAPLALSLVTVWPLELAVYGGDLFRRGGEDSGKTAFAALERARFVWSAVLVVVGARTVYGWSWGRSLASAAVTVLPPAVLVLLLEVARRSTPGAG